MSTLTIRPAYDKWPEYNRRLRDVVAGMTDEQLAMTPSPERWPLWATVPNGKYASSKASEFHWVRVDRAARQFHLLT